MVLDRHERTFHGRTHGVFHAVSLPRWFHALADISAFGARSVGEKGSKECAYVLDGALVSCRANCGVYLYSSSSSWKLTEHCDSRDLQWRQEKIGYTELALENLSKLYGTSPRYVYASAMDPTPHERRIFEEISTLTRENIADLLRKASSLQMSDEIFQYITEVAPFPDDRCDFTVRISTAHLVDQILDHLRLNDKRAALHLYQHSIWAPYSRASVGYILKQAFLEVFPDGGEWPVFTMKKRTLGKTNTHWDSESGAPREYLRLGFQGSAVTIEDGPIGGSGDSCGQLERHHFASKEIPTLERRFYIPQYKKEASFDAFVYDPDQRRATIFQVTGAEKRDVSIHGLDWLRNCGAVSVDLIVVTPPLDKYGSVVIAVPNSHQEKLCNVYFLALEG